MIRHIIKLIWNKKGSNALMILEILLSFLVLYFVLAYMFFNMERIKLPLGFEVDNRLRINLAELYKLDSLDINTAMKNLRAEYLSLEEIEGVSFTGHAVPFINSTSQRGSNDNGFEMSCEVVNVDLDFEEVMGIKMIQGRFFNEDDLNASITPIIVNRRFMDTYYPEKSMIDSTIIYGPECKIIGVLEDYRYKGEFSEPMPMVFYLEPFYAQHYFAVLKMREDVTAAFEEPLTKLTNQITGQTSCNITNLNKNHREQNRDSWLMLYALLAICIFLCLNVALGLFGVLWYNINKRRSEVGLRQALGAHSTDISKQFILEVLVLAGFALFIGLIFAIQIPLMNVTEYPSYLFYKAALYSSIIVLSLVTLCALIPSIQAARITPANSLHEN